MSLQLESTTIPISSNSYSSLIKELREEENQARKKEIKDLLLIALLNIETFIDILIIIEISDVL